MHNFRCSLHPVDVNLGAKFTDSMLCTIYEFGSCRLISRSLERIPVQEAGEARPPIEAANMISRADSRIGNTFGQLSVCNLNSNQKAVQHLATSPFTLSTVPFSNDAFCVVKWLKV